MTHCGFQPGGQVVFLLQNLTPTDLPGVFHGDRFPDTN